MAYKLSYSLTGHTADVRCLSVGHDGTLLTGSRDRTAILWKREKDEYEQQLTLFGHVNYVSSVCVLPPSVRYPQGLFLTGSHDSTIRVYLPDSVEPINIIEGHLSAVSHLSAADEGRFLSSSWDMTVKLWSAVSNKSVAVFEGHTMAVWCSVFVPEGLVITGCADKLIRMYMINGVFIRTFTGHQDCIRDLCYVGAGILLSCANDASIKRWDIYRGACVETMYGHPNYIYSIDCNTDTEEMIVSGGEDRCVRIWTPSNTEYLTIPAQSVWAVAILPNRDIIVGSSDGVIRVFTCDISRMAPDEIIFDYAKEVTKSNLENMDEVGGLKIKELPTKEVLNMVGKRDGQIQMIRENDEVMCYRWSEERLEWLRVGEVVGASGGTPQTSGKVLHEGKEYDYVFNVDLDDNRPPIKLPYNNSDDPWMVAQNFITQHQLDANFLSQIANFIISNSSAKPTELTDSNNMLLDPLTGTSRHVPYTHAVVSETVSKTESQVFPQTKYLRFDQTNVELIKKKLVEFNTNLKDENGRIERATLDEVVQLTAVDSIPEFNSVNALRELLLWPEEILFPVLDITRLAVRSPGVNTMLCSGESGVFLVSLLQGLLLHSPSDANKMLSLKLLSNCFCSSAGEELCLGLTYPMLGIIEILSSEMRPKSFQIALATLLLNYTVAHVRRRNRVEEGFCRRTAFSLVQRLTDEEALFRGLVTLGTILHALVRPIVPPDIFQLLNQCILLRRKDRIGECCFQIVDMLKRRTKKKNYNY